MSTVDLDSRAREAAAAARASVAPVAALAAPPPARRASGPRLLLTGGAVALVAAVALISLGDDVTRVSTGPAGQGAPAPSRAPGPPAPRPTPELSGAAVPLATGTAKDARAWQLFFNGPSNDLCLGFEGTGVCAGEPFGASAHRPVHFAELRAPAFVFGRVEAGVTGVSVVLGTGTTLGPEPVIEAEGGPFYVVELPDHTPPVAVVGHRPDGSTVRYDR